MNLVASPLQGPPGTSDVASKAPAARATEAGFLAALLQALGSVVPEAEVLARTTSDASGDAETATDAGEATTVAEDPSERAGDVTTGFPAPEAAIVSPALTAADRSAARIDPELRERIDRVVERMRSEYGHEVDMVEGYRTAERQQHLYAQGRTRPGQVVTWTRQSAHMDGRGADLRVDGGYDDALGYARLQKIAGQEGLVTLGMRDPGHVQLAGSRGQGATDGGALSNGGNSSTSGSASSTSGLASVARVAAVAAPAAVASMAHVATPGSRRATTADSDRLPNTPKPIAAPDAIAVMTPRPVAAPDPRDVLGQSALVTDASLSREAAVAAAPTRRSAGDKKSEHAATEEVKQPTGSTSQVNLLSGEPTAWASRTGAGVTGGVGGVDGVGSMERVEQVLEARDLARGLTRNRISMRIDSEVGDQIRVGLLGQSVDADLDVTDPVIARLMRTRVSELHRALGDRGLDLSSFGVRSAKPTDFATDLGFGTKTDAASEMLRTLLMNQSNDSARNGAPKERWNGGKHNDQGTDSHRSRRDPKEETK